MNENKKMPQIQEEQSRQFIARRSMSLALVLCLVLCSAVAVSAAEVETYGYENFEPVVDALKVAINMQTITAVLVAIIGASIGMVFTWWGVRKAVRALMAAFKKGKISI